MSEFMPLLRVIGPLVLFLCFLPHLVSRFRKRDDVVLAKLNKKLDPDVYHINKDVEIRTKERSVEINYIITSKFGIFVLQVRPFIGVVEGQANHVMWTSKGIAKVQRFSNPLNYNREAVSVLRSRYDFEPAVYHSLVVFRGKGKFGGTMPQNVRTHNNFIEYILSKDEELMKEKDVMRVHQQIRDGAIPNTLKTYSQYLDHAKELVGEYSIANKGRAAAPSGVVQSKKPLKANAGASKEAKNTKSKIGFKFKKKAKVTAGKKAKAAVKKPMPKVGVKKVAGSGGR